MVLEMVQAKDADGITPIEYAWINSSLDIYQVFTGFLNHVNADVKEHNILKIPEYYVEKIGEAEECEHGQEK